MAFRCLKIGVVIDTAADFQGFNLKPEDFAELSPQVQVTGTVDALKELGHEVDLIGSLFDLVQRLANITPGQNSPWDLVFNVAEGMFGMAREAQVPALLDAYRIPYTFSDSFATTLCLDKAMTKLKLLAHGIPTAKFFLLPSGHARLLRCEERADGVRLSYLDQEALFPGFPLFIKPNNEGSSKGIDEDSKLHSKAEVMAAVDRLSGQRPDLDLIIEQFLGGLECTVGILGTGTKARVLGTFRNKVGGEITDLELRTYGTSAQAKPNKTTDATFLTRADISAAGDVPVAEPVNNALVIEAEEIALKAHMVLGLRDCSRFDIRYDKAGPEGRAYIMEANTIPGLVPKYSAMVRLAEHHGMSFTQLIGSIVDSTAERIRNFRMMDGRMRDESLEYVS